MTDTLVRVDGLSKRYCMSLKRSLWYGLRDLGSELTGRRHGGGGELREQEFWAVKDVGFELARGECLGLIGHNGAGKTTLLRMLNGVIKPDAGRAEIRGRVGALIALGAGFNPILTGRENIYIYAAVLGVPKRHVDAKLDEIVDFAEIGPFLDTPVRSYSSGMHVRLGFSVAAILLEPDVLLLDEVLAVGDIGFVIKCLNAVRRMAKDAAVILVSHQMQHISSFCTRVLVMDHGAVRLDASNPADGIDCYYGLIHDQVQVSGTGEAEIEALELLVDEEAGREAAPALAQGAELAVRLAVRIRERGTPAIVSLFVHDEALSPVICSPLCAPDGRLATLGPGRHEIEIPLGTIDLNAGKYSFVVGVQDAETRVSLARVQGLSPFRVFSDRKVWGKIVRPAVARRTAAGTSTSGSSPAGRAVP
jgi:lipopolysaccharide transport system ATP-binding protein